jgi:hypothetical protein
VWLAVWLRFFVYEILFGPAPRGDKTYVQKKKNAPAVFFFFVRTCERRRSRSELPPCERRRSRSELVSYTAKPCTPLDVWLAVWLRFFVYEILFGPAPRGDKTYVQKKKNAPAVFFFFVRTCERRRSRSELPPCERRRSRSELVSYTAKPCTPLDVWLAVWLRFFVYEILFGPAPRGDKTYVQKKKNAPAVFFFFVRTCERRRSRSELPPCERRRSRSELVSYTAKPCTPLDACRLAPRFCL